MRLFVIINAALLLPCATDCAFAAHRVTAVETAEAITIDNGALSVRYDPKDGVFSAQRNGKSFIKRGQFENATDPGSPRVRTVNIKGALGAGKAVEIGFPSGSIYRLALYANLPFVCIDTSVHNPADKTIVISRLTPATLTADLGKTPADLRALGCDGLTPADANRTSYTFLAVADPKTTAGLVCGWLTQNRASGIVACTANNGLLTIEPRAEYGKLLVPAGKTAHGERLVIGYFDNALAGLEAYAEAIAKHYEITLPEIPSGYCTWYSNPHGGASDEKHMAELAEFCEENLTKFGFDTLQIDDKWQISSRDFTAHNPKGPYPNGMKSTAENIAGAGLTPGIWFIPFGWDHKRPVFADHQDWFVHREDDSVYSVKWAGDCLDMTHPEACKFLDEVIRRITHRWGYEYIKIDGLWTGMATDILYPQPTYRPDGLGNAVFHDPAKTNIQAYRDGLRLVRKAAGSDVYILGCNTAQNMRTLGASVGLVDAMRIGSDIGARWSGILKGATMGTRLYFFHNRVWHNDPDCLMLRDPLTLDQARAWGSWIGITGQLNMASEWLPGLPADKLDVVKRSMPNHGLCGRPLDLFENDPAQIWRLTAGTGQQRRDVVALFNWSDKQPAPVMLDPASLDLPGGGNGAYVGFDYWADKFVPPFTGPLKTDLPPSSCKVIALKPLLDRPVLVGTSRHVTQGIVDIMEEDWNSKTAVLSGKSKVVAGDPYELRIFAPTESWKIDSVALAKSDTNAGATVQSKHTGREIRVTIYSPTNRPIAWQIAFKKQ